MSDEAIRALDSDLEQSRNAFLHAREAQRRLSLNTHDVNRTGANKSRPDSTTPGVIHTHDVIPPAANESQPDSIITHDVNSNTHDVNRTGANKSRPDSTTPGVIHTHDVIPPATNESQPDSIITHDVNSNTHDVNRSGAQSRLDSNTHDVNRPEAQSRQNSNTHDVTRPGAQSRTNLDMQDVPPAPAAARVDESDSNTHDVNRPESQSRQISNTHDATPDLRKDAPHASERTSQDLPGSPITAMDPELPRPGDHAQGTAHAPRGRVPPSPTTLLIEQAEQGVREAVEGIPGEGILTPLTPFTERQKQQHREAAAAFIAMSSPLVWKTRNSFRNVTVKTYIRLRKRWGNSGPFDWFAAD